MRNYFSFIKQLHLKLLMHTNKKVLKKAIS